MRNVLLICAAFFSLVSCAPPARYDVMPGQVAKFYVVASWYSPEFEGRPTSSGEIYDSSAMTCGHRKYPFGTRLKVTNTLNSKSVECTVNDRGPFVKGREIDLSYAAAAKIDLLDSGIAPVSIEEVGRDGSYIKPVTIQTNERKGIFAIQLGSFSDSANAARLKMALEFSHANVYIRTALISNATFHRVRIGDFSTFEDAQEIAKKLGQEGYTALILKAE